MLELVCHKVLITFKCFGQALRLTQICHRHRAKKIYIASNLMGNQHGTKCSYYNYCLTCQLAYHWMKFHLIVVRVSRQENCNSISDGIYTISPPGKQPIKSYCDFTSHGGGWTLLVTSKTHSGWTSDNVKSRNADQPSLNNDFSILGYADSIKDIDISQVSLDPFAKD